MPHNVASDQGLHYLPLTQQFVDILAGNKIEFIQLLGQIFWGVMVSQYLG